ncbi:hypothetical protein PR202_ga00273 [Eleusine coracana subsp. coracana]|uniref:Protein kinase domain-containing protein n=1 Tax=Eleusine coracana subsp. coracana TaxID=191504 RepID=A0AAV5BG33_ELECO|nr:hypothetical protein PR202_ga00273 [Eleusine coracana subsp. coracana]
MMAADVPDDELKHNEPRGVKVKRSDRMGSRRWVLAAVSIRDDDAVEVPELTLRELNNATLSFSNERLIGEGFRSTVFRASLRGGKDAVAKRIDLRPYGAAVASDYKRHVSAASWLRHENVVRLLGYSIITAEEIVLIYELATMGTLHDVLHGMHFIPKSTRSKSWPPSFERKKKEH